ncbi:MAG: TonB-dependent receptor [Ferruginibacter sp.]
MKKIILLLITITALYIASAQNSITGKIITREGEPAAMVNIELKEQKKQTVSAADGTYSLSNIGEGKYTVIVSFSGLQTQHKTITIKNNETALIDFVLSENASQLEEVILTARKSQNEKPVNIGKILVKPMDLPQSIAVIGKDVIDRQQSLRLSEVIANTTGIYTYGNTGGTQQEFGGRGYAFNSSNTFKNGIRYNNAAMPEISALERVEVLKGSAAILFGNVAAGAVLNLVTKKPKFELGGELSFRAGSNSFYKPSVDIYGPVSDSKTLAYRFNATYENGKSFRDKVGSERVYINPSLLIKAGKKTTVLMEGDFLSDNRTLDYGTGAVNYVVANIPRSRFLGASWSYNKVKQRTTTITVTHDLNRDWKITSTTGYQGFSSELAGSTRPNASSQFVKTDGTWIRGLQKSTTEEKYFITQLDLTGNIKTGKIDHSLLVGADADKYNTDAGAFEYKNITAGNKNIYDSINIYDLDKYTQRTDIPLITATTLTHTPTSRVGIYLQDIISLSAKFKILAGIRYTDIKRNGAYTDTLAKATRGFSTNTNDEAYTPRFGLVYQPLKIISVFASYANSFILNTGTDMYLNPLDPSFLDQYEAGIKTELFKKLISANLTVYKITNSNLAQMSLTREDGSANSDANIKELAGAVSSKGLEIDITTKPIYGIQLISGYSFNETKYTSSNTYIVGSRLLYNPQHTAHTSIFYSFSNRTFLKGFNIGAISYYIGKRVAGRSTRIRVPNDTYKPMPLPDYFQFDATLGYTFKKISIRAKVSNIFNKLSYYVHDDNSVNPIAPTQFSAIVSMKL